MINTINNWIIANFGWAASVLALSITGIGIIAMFSKFGNVTIGGEGAKPELSNFAWFSIALTTTMAAGILFWGPGEPIVHYMAPPTEIYGIEPLTPAAMKFSMETMFLHWTIVPYAMYTVPAVVFAFMYYNGKKPFSIASEMAPMLGEYAYRSTGSIAQGLMNISGGISKMTGLPSDPRLWLAVGIAVGVAIVATSVSGIQKGKLDWGVIVIVLGYIMISLIGIDGVKIIANFGGMFAEVIMIGATVNLGMLIHNHKKYDLSIPGNKDEIFEMEK